MGAHQKLLGAARLQATPRHGAVLFILAVYAAPLVSCSVVQIPKCCPLHQQLSYDFDTCIDYEGSAENASDWWVSRDVVLPLGGRWLAAPGRRHGCSAAAATLWLQDAGDVAVAGGGRLLVDVAGQERPLALEPALYCLDRAQIGGGRRVALSCLCGLRPLRCWTSCCPAGWALALTASTSQQELRPHCRRPAQPHHWQPRLATAGANATPWRVTSLPKCEEGEHVVVLPAGRQYRLLASGGAAVEDGESPGPRQLAAHEYCADAEHFLYCKSRAANPGSGERARRVVYVCLLALGAAFLLATVAVYCCLPVLLSRVLSRALVAHCCALLVAYITTAVLHAASHIPHPACTITAFVMQFSYLAAFFWLNVMCIDIALAVSRRSCPQEGSAGRERRRFLVYSGYAWGMPATICAITAAVDFSPAVPTTSQLKPNIGSRTCWFQGEKAMLLYFYGPVSCVMFVNILLFILTAINSSVKSEKQSVSGQSVGNNHSSPSDTVKAKRRTQRERLLMFSKIFILMGLTWVTDILSWIFGGQNKIYWIVTDAINILRPAFIFYIFCCNRRILRMLVAHLPCFSGRSSNHTSSITESGSSMKVYKVHSNDGSHNPTVQYTALFSRELSYGDHHP